MTIKSILSQALLLISLAVNLLCPDPALCQFSPLSEHEPTIFSPGEKKMPAQYKALVSAGRFEDAIKYLDHEISLTPNVKRLYYLRGQCKAALKDFPAAVADYDRARAFAPKDKDINMARGLANKAARNYPEAAKDFENCMSSHRDLRHIFGFLVETHLAMNKPDLAVADMNRVVKRYPKDLEQVGKRGELLLKLKRYKEARADFVTVLRDNPEEQTYLKGLGDLDYLEGHYLYAINSYTHAINSDPSMAARIYACRSMANAKVGNKRSAEIDMAAAIKLGFVRGKDPFGF